MSAITAAWWQPGARDGLERWLRDFLDDALLRKGLSELLADPATDSATLLNDPGAFGFNSLDMVSTASRAADCLGLDHTGLADLLLARRSFQGWLDVARRSLAIDDSAIGFYSSGSTGSPALSRHTTERLLEECQVFAQLMRDTGFAPGRVVSTVSSHHIYGFIWSQLLPAAMNLPVLAVKPTRTLPATWTGQLQAGDIVVSTPELWQMIVDLQLALPETFIGISSSGQLDPAVASQLRQRNPGARLIEVYGSTETAGIAYRMADGDDFQLLPYWALDRQDTSCQLRHRYRDIATELQDNIDSPAPQTLRLLGRRDDTVQINGHNINLVTLGQMLSQHPDVAEAQTRAMDVDGRRQLACFLALSQPPDNPGHWCREFSTWLRSNLGNVPPPASVTIGPALPRSALGKAVSWQPQAFPRVPGMAIFRSAFATE